MNLLIRILCIFLIFSPPVIQIILCTNRLQNTIKMPLYAIDALLILCAIVLSFAAMIILMNNIPPGIHCATPKLLRELADYSLI